ncbi:hypothetical protein WK12_16405 [Burkholderia ubonensis]|nr:hypothetical protein WK12_16405 [Burkholderia ubonensis]
MGRRDAAGVSGALPLSDLEGRHMKPGICVLTIGVDDLETAMRFFRDGLGLETEGIVGTEFESSRRLLRP